MYLVFPLQHLNGKPHFTTWHGQVGLGTVIYVAIQCCAGTILLYPKYDFISGTALVVTVTLTIKY